VCHLLQMGVDKPMECPPIGYWFIIWLFYACWFICTIIKQIFFYYLLCLL